MNRCIVVFAFHHALSSTLLSERSAYVFEINPSETVEVRTVKGSSYAPVGPALGFVKPYPPGRPSM